MARAIPRNGSEAAKPGKLRAALAMVFRVSAISLGGYALVSAVCILLGMVLQEFGIRLSEAMLTTLLLGYIAYVPLVMWAFVDPASSRRAWIILIAAVITMALATWLAPGYLPPPTAIHEH